MLWLFTPKCSDSIRHKAQNFSKAVLTIIQTPTHPLGEIANPTWCWIQSDYTYSDATYPFTWSYTLIFAYFPQRLPKLGVAACTCLAPRNGIIPWSCCNVIITFKNNCWVWKNDAFLPCVTPNYKLIPFKPLRHTMPDDDKEAQTTSGIVMISYRLSWKMETLISRQLTDMKSLS